MICLFVVASAHRSLSYQSIKVYLFGVQFHSLLHGYPVKMMSMTYLYYTLRGVRRIQGNTLVRPSRNPITIPNLWSMLAFLSCSKFSIHDKAMWHCLVVTAFFGLLRVSEFTCDSNNFDSAFHLSPEDVTFNSEHTIMYIKIKESKTDPFRSGCTIRLAAIKKHMLCPVTAMRKYLEVRSQQPGPLYVLDNGQFVSRKFVVAFLGISLPGVTNINTHSFRIGGASAALSAGASDALIRIMGRWSSDAYNRYIRVSDKQVFQFQSDLSTSTVRTNNIWDTNNV